MMRRVVKAIAKRRERKRILVVDSDPIIRRDLVTYLEEKGMHAISAVGRQEVLGLVTIAAPSLIILELAPERQNGLDLLNEIRSLSNLPIIVTASKRSDDLVFALELGADDAVVRPFSVRELFVRVRTVLRGRSPFRKEAREHSHLRFGGWQLDRSTRRLTAPDGSPVTLTKREYALLVAFLGSPNRPLTRNQLLRATRLQQDVVDRSIDGLIFRLRHKLEPDRSRPTIIRAERGVGYVFTLEVEPLG